MNGRQNHSDPPGDMFLDTEKRSIIDLYSNMLKSQITTNEAQNAHIASKKEKLASFKQELFLKNQKEKQHKFELQEEMKRKMIETKRDQIQRLKEYKERMKRDEASRMSSLLSSCRQVSVGTVGSVNQSINKNRKNTETLIKFLISYKYANAVPTSSVRIPNEFTDYHAYQNVFQPLILNEFASSVSNAVGALVKDKCGSRYISCLMRVHNNIATGDDYTMIEVKESKDNEGGEHIMTYQNNYLVLISSAKVNSIEQVNNNDFKNGFCFIGYMNSDHKITPVETPLIYTMVDHITLKRFIKGEWKACYVRPLERITTYIREYVSLNSLVYSDVNQFIFRPQDVSNVINTGNQPLYEKFFQTITPKYNQGQLAAIKNVSLSRNGICLLQGPPGTGKTHTLIGIVSAIFHYLRVAQNTHRRHIMICAPSNPAINEIILRIQQYGLYGENGEIISPKVVRVGILDQEPHELVKDCALENIAEKQMNGVNQEMLRVGEKERYNQIVQHILYSADIICCTLTSSGTDKLDKLRDYIEAVIVDEASQCTESSNIIPLQYSPKKLILIGDPQQLPPTTFSSDSTTTRFNRSLFERIIDSGVNPFFLYEQYRMVSNIRKFPSAQFYDNRLTDAPNISERQFPSYLLNFQNKNVLFLDLKYAKETVADKSYFNTSEISVCMHILELIVQKMNAAFTAYKNIIGCITPYKKQVHLLNDELRNKYGVKYRDHIAVNTVDAFQGQEKDIVLLSTVRANPNGLIGFLSDVRRLNVAITRPRFALIVVGNSATLATNDVWRSFLEHLIDNQCYIGIQEEKYVERVVQIIFRNEKIPSYLTNRPVRDKKKVAEYDEETKEKIEKKLKPNEAEDKNCSILNRLFNI